MEDNNNNQNNNDKSNTPVGTEDERRKKNSLAVAMAKASLLSQKAAVQEQANFRAMLELQREKNELRKNEVKLSNKEAKLARDKRIQAMQMSYEERSATTKLLQKMVERLCPEEDPADCFVARKHKLDELRESLGEDLYVLKLEQLKEEFKKISAM
jgi:hypothetical protein